MFKVDRLIYRFFVLSCFSEYIFVGLYVYYMYVSVCNMFLIVLNFLSDFGLFVYINV